MSLTAAQLNVRFQTEGADRAKRDINDVGKAVDNADAKRRMMGVGFAGTAAAIGGMFFGATQQSIGFGEQLANVNSIAQLGTEQISDLGDEVLELATKTGQGPEVLAAGLYDIYSSGFAGAEGLQVLTASANAANAGLTTTDVAARAITATLNAYGMEASDAEHVSNVLFQTVNEGVITFEQLANNLGNTLPLANALGVSFEELGAAYAQMTLKGVGASQAETQIAALMRSAINPTDDLTAAVQDYGYANVEGLLAAEGMVGFLALLDSASGGSKEALFDLLGTTEAVNAALILGADGGKEYAASVERMKASSEGLGATQVALEKQMESTAFSLRLLKTNIQAAAIAIGVQLEPGIRFVAKAMTAALKLFLNLPKPVQRIIAGVTALVGVLAAGAGAWILFGTQIKLAAALFVSILGPIALVVAAVAGLYLAWKTNFLGLRSIVKRALSPIIGFIDRFKKAWDDLGDTDLGQFVDQWAGLSVVVGNVNSLSRVLFSLADAIRGIGGDNTPAWLVSLAEGFDRAAEFVTKFKDAWDDLGATDLGQFADQWAGLFVGNDIGIVERAITALDIATGGLITRLREMTALDFAIAIGGWIVSAAVDLGSAVIGWVRNTAIPAVGNLIENFPAITVNVLDWVKGKVADLWETVKGWALGYDADAGMSGDGTGGASPEKSITLGAIAVNIGSWAKGIVTDIWPFIRQWAEAAISGATSAAATIWNVLVNIGSWAKGIVSDIWPFAKQWAAAAWDAVSTAAHTIWGVLVDVGSWAKGTWADLFLWVQQEVSLAWIGNEDAPFGLGTVSVKVSDWDVEVDVGSLYTKIDDEFRTRTAATPEKTQSAKDAGRSHGEAFRDAFSEAWNNVFSFGGGGGAGGGGAGGDTGLAAMRQRAVDYFQSFSDGLLGEGFWTKPIPLPALNVDFSDVLSGFETGAELMAEGFGNLFGPDAPIWVPFKVFGSWFEGLWDDIWDFDLSIPTIDFPDWDLPALEDIPFVKTFMDKVEEITGYFTDFEWPDFDIPMPPNPFSGGGEPSDGVYKGGGGSGDELPARRPANQLALLGGTSSTINIDNRQALDAIGAVKMAADGLKASLGGGGGRGAMGAGAGPGGGLSISIDTSPAITALSALQTAMNGAIAGVANGMVTIAGVVTGGMNSVSAAAAAGMSLFRGAVSLGMSGAVAEVRRGANRMVSAVIGITGRMYGAGQDAMTGLTGGVRSGLGGLSAVVDEAIAIMGRIPKMGRSPWPMMIGAGQDAMDGLVLGIEHRQRALAATIGSTISLFDATPRFALAGASTGGGFNSTPSMRGGSMGGGSMGGITINAPFTVNGPVYGVDDLDQKFAEYTQGLADELRRHRIASGMAA